MIGAKIGIDLSRFSKFVPMSSLKNAYLIVTFMTLTFATLIFAMLTFATLTFLTLTFFNIVLTLFFAPSKGTQLVTT